MGLWCRIDCGGDQVASCGYLGQVFTVNGKGSLRWGKFFWKRVLPFSVFHVEQFGEVMVYECPVYSYFHAVG
jgi:hypothetical protein